MKKFMLNINSNKKPRRSGVENMQELNIQARAFRFNSDL